MNLLADVAVQAARHAITQTPRALMLRGTVTTITAAPSGQTHGTATVTVNGFATAATVANLAGAVAGQSVLIEFSAPGVASVAYII